MQHGIFQIQNYNMNHKSFCSYAMLGITLLLAYSCANVGMPSGGPKDTTPPIIIKASPPNFSTYFSTDEVSIHFDEYIQLKNLSKQLIVSPPLASTPKVIAKGKKLIIQFEDSLKANTTYSLNFGNAIVDNNEGNPLADFQYVFSTGEKLDSLKISGVVKDAFTQKPVEGAVVMLYKKAGDSLLLTDFPYYVGRADKDGKFAIRNIADTTYSLIALLDMNSNYKLDMADELLDYSDSTITPWSSSETKIDTVQVDSLTGKTISETPDNHHLKDTTVKQVLRDSVITRQITHFYPDSLSLELFKNPGTVQALSTKSRKTASHIEFTFKNPHLEDISFEIPGNPLTKQNTKLIYSENRDTLDVWLLDSLIYQQDTIFSLISYYKTDSLSRLNPQTDSLRLSFRADEKTNDSTLVITTDLKKQGQVDINEGYRFKFNQPILEILSEKIRMVEWIDSIQKPVSFNWEIDSLNPTQCHLHVKQEAGKLYELEILPSAFLSMYGIGNDSLSYKMQVKKADSYGVLILTLNPVASPLIIDILNEKGVLITTYTGKNFGKCTFSHLLPDKYTVRVIMDENGDGKWNSGNYIKKIKPEKVLYPLNLVQVRANWDVEMELKIPETINLQSEPDSPELLLPVQP